MLISISLSIIFQKDICSKTSLDFQSQEYEFFLILILGQWTVESILVYFGRKRIGQELFGYSFIFCFEVL